MGDHYFNWYGEDNKFIHVGFRPNEEGNWVCCGFNTSGFTVKDIPENMKVEYKSVSEITGEPSESTGPETYTVASGAAPESKVTVTVPGSGWIPKSVGKLFIYNALSKDDIGSNTPVIEVDGQESMEQVNYYKSNFKNLQDIAPRTIGGIAMQGRTYKFYGMDWTEYYGQGPSGAFMTIRISGISIDEGTEGAGILDSMEIK